MATNTPPNTGLAITPAFSSMPGSSDLLISGSERPFDATAKRCENARENACSRIRQTSAASPAEPGDLPTDEAGLMRENRSL